MKSSSSLYVVLFIAFADLMGIGLVYPMFSSMLFDSSLPLLPADASHATRGFYLGLLLALMPLAQFFSSPIWGALSDNKGRKLPLQTSLVVAFFGYLVALGGLFINNIWLLLISRLFVGYASGNMSIVQATVADVSTPEDKAKNFGLYTMSLGLGFTLGPFFGGVLSSWSYMTPFIFALAIIALNFLFTTYCFKETHHKLIQKKLSWTMGLTHLKKAFHFYGVRTILFASFLHCFAWSYFFEFIPVYLISRFQFSPAYLGLFFALAGGVYALGTGLLIRPFVKRFKPETLFFGGNLLTGGAILAMLLVASIFWIWPMVILFCFLVSFVWPNAITLVSNAASSEIQGESLGILTSVNAAALFLSPLFSGSLIGTYPTLSMWVGGILMITAALIVLAIFRGRLFHPK